MPPQRTIRKTSNQEGQIPYEVAGLKWLEAAGEETHDQSPLVVPVLKNGTTWLEEPRLATTTPTKGAAEEFGRRLAHLHAAGASHLGSPPPEYKGPGWIGNAPLSLPTSSSASSTWGHFYAKHRILPYLDAPFSESEKTLLRQFCDLLESGKLDHPQPGMVASSIKKTENINAARIHGDMWNGNLMWTKAGVTLIDPAAQGGHAEEDFGFLSLFGSPHFDRITRAYNEISPFAEGWRDRLELHQMHVLMVHCYLFGRSYVGQTVEVASHYLSNRR